MKRFSDTCRFEQEWYSDLPPEMKCLYELVWAKADNSGVWSVNRKLAEFHIGKKIQWEDFLERTKGVVFPLSEKEWMLGGFVEMQCGKLSQDCRPHQVVIDLLRKRNLLSDTLSIVYPIDYQIVHSTIKGTGTVKGEGVQGEEETTETKGPRPFDEFWSAYPKKAAKGDAEKVWKNLKCDSLLPKILTTLRKLKISEAWTKDGGKFIPYPQRWLNRKGWEDDFEFFSPEMNRPYIDEVMNGSSNGAL